LRRGIKPDFANKTIDNIVIINPVGFVEMAGDEK
jgi:hypothetical protein